MTDHEVCEMKGFLMWCHYLSVTYEFPLYIGFRREMGIVSWPFIGMIRFFGCNRLKCCGSTDWHVKLLVTEHVVCGIMLLSIPPYPAAQPNTKICTVTLLLLQEHWGCQSHNVNLGLTFNDVLLLKRVIVSMTQESSRGKSSQQHCLEKKEWVETSGSSPWK